MKSTVLFASPFVSYANLEKECVIVGVNDRLEIWSKNNWEKFFNDKQDDLSDIAENLFEIGDF